MPLSLRRFGPASLASLFTASFVLAGCTSDDEKIMRAQEELATIIDADKADCDRMATDIAKFGDAKGKELQKLKAKLIKEAGSQEALQARLKQKFGDRDKALTPKMMGGMKCLLSEPVAIAMMKVDGDGEDQPDRKPPEQPANGAPVALVVDKVTDKALDVSAYNFGDKTFASYNVLIRFYGADGTALKPRMSFEKDDFMHWSFAGKGYRVPPKQWRAFHLDHLDVPAGAVKADVRLTGVTAVVNGGVKMEEQPTWKTDAFTWPDARAAK